MYSVLLLTAVLLLIVLFSAVWKIHPAPVLLAAGAIFGVASGMTPEETLAQLAAGFGKTMGGIGFIIIAGTVIGLFMERRGALARLAERTLAVTGEKRIPAAISGIGFVASIAIFCDSAFVILIGLVRNICRRAGLPLAVGATALSMGLFATHCMVPPTPGPVAAAEMLGADLGRTILFGLAAALAAALCGRFFAAVAGRGIQTDSESSTTDKSLDKPSDKISDKLPDDSPEKTPDKSSAGPKDAPNNSSAEIYRGSTPAAALPILLPLLMILAASVYALATSETFQTSHAALTRTIRFAGLPVVALSLGALLAIFGLGRRRPNELTVGGTLGEAILQAANILVITSAGGAFGELLRQTPAAGSLFSEFGASGRWTIFLPLLVAAFVKTAQGSSTVAIITTAGLFAPLLETLHLDGESARALTVVAIGCGSMIVSHANDSYFWVVTQFSGLSVRQGLKLQTLGTLVCGAAAAAVIGLLAAFC